MICPKCGASIPDGSQGCSICDTMFYYSQQTLSYPRSQQSMRYYQLPQQYPYPAAAPAPTNLRLAGKPLQEPKDEGHSLKDLICLGSATIIILLGVIFLVILLAGEQLFEDPKVWIPLGFVLYVAISAIIGAWTKNNKIIGALLTVMGLLAHAVLWTSLGTIDYRTAIALFSTGTLFLFLGPLVYRSKNLL